MEMNDKVIRRMISQGYIEIAGVNAVGDEIYKFTQKFYDEKPEIIEYIRTTESDTMSSLWFKGFIDLKMDDESSMYIYLTEKSETWYDTEELTEDEKAMMYIIYSTGNFYDVRKKGRR
jgi:helix-turn-helix protein